MNGTPRSQLRPSVVVDPPAPSSEPDPILAAGRAELERMLASPATG